MNTEQHTQQQKAAAAIEQGVHDIAALHTKLARGLNLAVDGAAQSMLSHTVETLGQVSDRGAKAMQDICAEALEPVFAAAVKSVGVEILANSPASVFESIGRGWADQQLGMIGHKFTDRGREVQKRLLDRERGAEVREAGVTHHDPVALQVNPSPMVIKSATEVLADLEQRGRQYPAKRKK
jgi:hypothetical protein